MFRLLTGIFMTLALLTVQFCEELSEQLHTIAIDKELFAIASAISKLYAIAFACSFHLQTVNSSSIDIPLRQAFIPCFHYK